MPFYNNVSFFQPGDQIHWTEGDNKGSTNGVISHIVYARLFVRVVETERIVTVRPDEVNVAFGHIEKPKFFGRGKKGEGMKGALKEMWPSPWTDGGPRS